MAVRPPGMLTVIEARAVEGLRGRWVELAYDQSFRSQPVRPLFRAWLEGGGKLDWILPAAAFGRARWIGLMPATLVRYELLADLPDVALLRFGPIRPVPLWRLRLRLLARDPLALAKEVLPRLIRTTRGRVNNVRAGLLQDPLERVDRFARDRSRPVEPDGFDAPVAPGEAPPVGFVLVCRGDDRAAAFATLASLAAQADPGWRLEAVTDDPTTRNALEAEAGRLGIADRVGASVGHVSLDGPPPDDASAWSARLSPGDRLPAWCVLTVRAEIAARPDLALLYTDSAALGSSGKLASVELQPNWSPEWVRSGAMPGGLRLWRPGLPRELGASSVADEAAMLLGAADRLDPDRLGHLARIAVHRARRPEPPDGPVHLVTRERGGASGSVAIVMPTRDRLDLLRPAVESVLGLTEYPDFELVVADNGSAEPDTLRYLDGLRSRRGCRVVDVPGEFNFSLIVNRAVAETRQDLVVLLNNDTEVVESGWLARLAGLACRPDVGAVGARLLYPSGRIQHAGVVLGWGGYAGHFGRNLPAGRSDHLARGRVTHEVSAVTAACLAVSRRAFDTVDGFDESFAVDFNDVDFCLRLRAGGLRNLYCPGAVLRHYESASRRHTGERRARFVAERTRFGERWRASLQADPYFPRLLSLNRNDEQLE